jgi:ornithine carbamoyltransferase
MGPSDVQLGVNESMKVLSRFNSLILARVFGHKDIAKLAKCSNVPIVNAMSDLHRPLQTLADLMALQQHFGKALKGKTVAWVGDGDNVNVLHHLTLRSVKMGMNVQIATPAGCEPEASILAKTQLLAKKNGVKVTNTAVSDEAVAGSDVVVVNACGSAWDDKKTNMLSVWPNLMNTESMRTSWLWPTQVPSFCSACRITIKK